QTEALWWCQRAYCEWVGGIDRSCWKRIAVHLHLLAESGDNHHIRLAIAIDVSDYQIGRRTGCRNSDGRAKGCRRQAGSTRESGAVWPVRTASKRKNANGAALVKARAERVRAQGRLPQAKGEGSSRRLIAARAGEALAMTTTAVLRGRDFLSIKHFPCVRLDY